MRILSVTNLIIGILLTAQFSVYAAQAPTPTKTSSGPSIGDLDRRIRYLEFQLKLLQNRVAYRSATLDCNSGKYDEFLFETGALVFFAACTKIEPYLEGHRVSINIGNPHSFDFSNIKGLLYYGKDLKDSFEKKVDVSVPEAIKSGSWNTISVIVNPSKVEEMRYLNLELKAETAAGSTR